MYQLSYLFYNSCLFIFVSRFVANILSFFMWSSLWNASRFCFARKNCRKVKFLPKNQFFKVFGSFLVPGEDGQLAAWGGKDGPILGHACGSLLRLQSGEPKILRITGMAASYHYNCTDGRNVVFLPELIPPIQASKFNCPYNRVHQDVLHVFKAHSQY